MIGLDTNVLVSYFAQDDPIQSPRAVELIERLDEGNPELTDQELAAIIERLLQAPVLVIEDEVEVFIALTALKEGRADFADPLLGELGHKAGCSVTFTFDPKAARLARFALA